VSYVCLTIFLLYDFMRFSGHEHIFDKNAKSPSFAPFQAVFRALSRADDQNRRALFMRL